MSQSQDALVARIDREWNTIRGRMLGLIESWGLPSSQEAGAKSSFKALSSDAQVRIATLLTDDALRQQMTSVAEAIAEIEHCQAMLASEAELSGDAEATRPTEAFLGQRRDELLELQQDLKRLERLQRSLGRSS